MWQLEVVYNWQCRTMVLHVLCVVIGCSTRPECNINVPFMEFTNHHYNKVENKNLELKTKKQFCSSISKRDMCYRKMFSLRQGEYLLNKTQLSRMPASTIIHTYLAYLSTV